MDFKNKYLKYKKKYLELKSQSAGGEEIVINVNDDNKIVINVEANDGSFDDAEKILKINGMIFKNIDLTIIKDKKWVEYLALVAVIENGLALEFVPKEFITKLVAENAVKQNGLALKFLPKESITMKVAENAVEQNGLALKFVPKESITMKVAGLAVMNNGLALEFVPVNLKPDDESIKQNAYDVITEVAIEQNQLAIQFYKGTDPDLLKQKK